MYIYIPLVISEGFFLFLFLFFLVGDGGRDWVMEGGLLLFVSFWGVGRLYVSKSTLYRNYELWNLKHIAEICIQAISSVKWARKPKLAELINNNDCARTLQTRVLLKMRLIFLVYWLHWFQRKVVKNCELAV